ncbi:MAG: redoxin domain-containing protein [Nitrospinaceae bacterium]|nr:thioredoxin family protein [Nitrospinaceae bacterium]NIR57882.1 thioredoxin family protein [Nitrospinaceae bacterium]NIS88341.1 thioredoxin family protein [Nitrospinaceae bacterium]NIT85219.1 thioredoxin family protein [Nitrospinaceae bacterium]NIU47371.1 thioredoxin family protein [Nitrospinaceae bacterium]
MALMHSTMVPLGSPAHDFKLPGVDGKEYTLESFKDQRVLVIVFMCNHCPYVKAVLPRLVELQSEYQDRNVQFVGINSNDAERYPDDSFENMKKAAREKGIPFPYLYDETQEVARQYDAVCTPDIYVYGADRKLQYRGRVDDNWEHPEKVTRRDLKDAIEHILQGQPVREEQIPSMGCSIKWKQ